MESYIYLGDDDNNNPEIMPFESRTIPVYAKLAKYYMTYEHGEPSEKSREWFWKEVFRGLTELDKSNITESTMTICPIITLSK